MNQLGPSDDVHDTSEASVTKETGAVPPKQDHVAVVHIVRNGKTVQPGDPIPPRVARLDDATTTAATASSPAEATTGSSTSLATERDAQQLAQHLHVAAEALLDRLFSYLSKLQPDEEERDDFDDDLGGRNTRQPGDSNGNNNDHVAENNPPKGLTLAASALGWLSSQLYHSNRDGCVGRSIFLSGRDHPQISADLWSSSSTTTSSLVLSASIRDRLSLLRFLLPRATHIRITSDAWPSHDRTPTLARLEAALGHPENNDHGALSPSDMFIDYYLTLCRRPQLDMRVFPKCQVLLMDQVPSEWLQNLCYVRHSLQVLRIERCCIYDLARLLLKDQNTQSGQGEYPTYPRLTHVKFAHCSLTDSSGLRPRRRRHRPESGVSSEEEIQVAPLSALTHAQTLGLAHNQLSDAGAALAGLSRLSFLTQLDLSYNHLTALESAYYRLGNLQTLWLSHNQIQSVQGIDRLYSLVHLWLDYNQLSDLTAVSGLGRLPELRSLRLAGNPLQERLGKAYRVHILDLFQQARFQALPSRGITARQILEALPVLDDQKATHREIRALRQRYYTPTPTMISSDVTDIVVADAATVDDVNTPSISVTLPTLVQNQAQNRRRLRPRKAPIDEGPPKFNLVISRQGETQNLQPSFSLHDVLHSLSEFNGSSDPAQDSLDESLPQDKERTDQVDAITEADDSNDETVPLIKPRIFLEEIEKPPNSSTEVFVANTQHEERGATESVGRHSEQVDELLSHASDANVGGELATLSLSPIMKADKDNDPFMNREVATPNAAIVDAQQPLNLQENGSVRTPDQSAALPEMHGNPHTQKVGHSRTSSTASSVRLALQVVSFPDSVWQGDNISLPSSVVTPQRDETSGIKQFQLAEEHSTYDGPDLYRRLNILENVELYFRLFVFAAGASGPSGPSDTLSLASGPEDSEWTSLLQQYPRIQLRPVDRCHAQTPRGKKGLLASSDGHEEFRRVWREVVVACGKPALKRLTPCRAPRFSFHGELMWSSSAASQQKPEAVAESREVLVCLSTAAFYVLVDHDKVSNKMDMKRKFPRPIPKTAVFKDALWPHALARHPLETLRSVTIGFGFQRLNLMFSESVFPGCDEFSYTLLTCNKLETIALLKEIQDLTNEVHEKALGIVAHSASAGAIVSIENDDRQVLDALGIAVAPDALGVILHFQILKQRWKHGERGEVRRVCVVTDAKIYLLDEDYVGDGSETTEAGSTRRLGQAFYRLLDSSDLQQIVKVQGAGADPCAITLVIRPPSMMQRLRNWRLKCRDRHGAERLVEDVRKAISLQHKGNA